MLQMLIDTEVITTEFKLRFFIVDRINKYDQPISSLRFS